MRIAVFGGTTEGRLLAEKLSRSAHEVWVFVATDLGAEELRGIGGIRVRAGRLSGEEAVCALRGFDLIVDATHPYALEISRNLRRAAEDLQIPLRRIRRESDAAAGTADDGTLRFASAEEAARYLADTEGPVLLTTGAKELPAFAGISPERLVVRVLPTHEALSACEGAGIPHRNIIAMQGPFSRETNEALMRQFGIRFLVTKESGSAGGFLEKLEAAGAAGVRAVVIERPAEEGTALPAEELLRELL